MKTSAENKLKQLASAALSKTHNSIDRAVAALEKDICSDRDMVRELLRFYLTHVAGQRADGIQQAFASHMRPETAGAGGHYEAEPHVRHAPTPRAPHAHEIAAEALVRRRHAQSIFDRELTASGRQWGNVFYTELNDMTEDGAIAAAVRAHLGLLHGDERLKQVRDLMTPLQFTHLINKVRNNSKKVRHAA